MPAHVQDRDNFFPKHFPSEIGWIPRSRIHGQLCYSRVYLRSHRTETHKPNSSLKSPVGLNHCKAHKEPWRWSDGIADMLYNRVAAMWKVYTAYLQDMQCFKTSTKWPGSFLWPFKYTRLSFSGKYSRQLEIQQTALENCCYLQESWLRIWTEGSMPHIDNVYWYK